MISLLITPRNRLLTRQHIETVSLRVSSTGTF
jgi:hypothetical protein